MENGLYQQFSSSSTLSLLPSSSSSSSASPSTQSKSSTLTSYNTLYPDTHNANDGADVIDLTKLPDSDEEEEIVNTTSVGHVTGSNSACIGNLAPTCFAKFTLIKQVRVSKLKRYIHPVADQLHWTCFSEKSRQHYRRLQHRSKETYVGTSSNPFLEKALFTAQFIKAGEFIMIYEGQRMSIQECSARQKKGRPFNYTLDITKGVVIDAFGFTTGAGMANHSCKPNARLRHGYLSGKEHAPYGYLQAILDIPIGTEIECNYGYLNKLSDEMIESLFNSGQYIPCHCLKVGCRKILSPL